MTGASDAAGQVAMDIFRHIQPTLDRMLAKQVADLYSGVWLAADRKSSANIGVADGSMWITELTLNGTDVLRLTQGIEDLTRTTAPITLWSTERKHEFR